MQPVTVALSLPIQDFGQPVASLVISREVEIGDLIAVEPIEGKMERTLHLIQRLYRTPEGKEVLLDSLRHLRPADYRALDKAMLPFTVLGLPTGAKS